MKDKEEHMAALVADLMELVEDEARAAGRPTSRDLPTT